MIDRCPSRQTGGAEATVEFGRRYFEYHGKIACAPTSAFVVTTATKGILALRTESSG